MTDSIELVARGNGFDGVIVLVGCDKTIPAGAMALARLQHSRLVLYGGSIAPGRWHGKDVTIQDVFEAVGAQAAGKMSLQDLQSLEFGRLSGRRRLRRASSRPTRWRSPSSSSGSRRLGSRQRTGDASGQAGCGPRGRRARDELVKSGGAPARHHHQGGLENAIGVGGRDRRLDQRRAAPDGHCAREAGVDLSLEDFDASAPGRRCSADLKPSGRFVANDMFAAGGGRRCSRSGS